MSKIPTGITQLLVTTRTLYVKDIEWLFVEAEIVREASQEGC